MATQTLVVTETTAPPQTGDAAPPISPAVDDSSPKAAKLQPLEVEEPSSQQDENEPNYPKGAQFWLIFVSLGLVLILAGMDANIVATAVP